MNTLASILAFCIMYLFRVVSVCITIAVYNFLSPHDIPFELMPIMNMMLGVLTGILVWDLIADHLARLGEKNE